MNTPHHTWSDSPIHEQIRTMNENQLATVTEQRDEARETLAELRASLTTKR